MKFVRYAGGCGVVFGDEVADASDLLAAMDWEDPGAGDPLVPLVRRLAALRPETLAGLPRLPLEGLAILSPVVAPTKILAAPNNYRDHTHEMAAGSAGYGLDAPLDQAGFFLKATSSLVGPSEGIALRFPERRTDYEVELVAVIGRSGTGIPAADALSHVMGYSLGLDITLRGPEERSLRKSIDSYTVLGPFLVTADEFPDLAAIEIALSLNGEQRQRAKGADMIFGVAEMVAFASRYYTLHPGDLIFCGTPSGVGPIKPGDVIEISGTGLGSARVAVREG
jgi:2-keto-4-pentenoate hydratase/2-oxohepta-3-ene-1,7-dioic acid hydratase in catechol pathway